MPFKLLKKKKDGITPMETAEQIYNNQFKHP